jgi:hypothetical protein
MDANHAIADRIRKIVEEYGSTIGYQQVQDLLRERYGYKNVPLATIFNVRWKMVGNSQQAK